MNFLLSIETGLREAVTRLHKEKKRTTTDQMNEIISIGGLIFCDGLDIETGGNNYFPFNISQFERRRRHLQAGKSTFALQGVVHVISDKEKFRRRYQILWIQN